MGFLLRLLLTRLLPARLAWVAAAFVIGKALAGRQDETDAYRRREHDLTRR